MHAQALQHKLPCHSAAPYGTPGSASASAVPAVTFRQAAIWRSWNRDDAGRRDGSMRTRAFGVMLCEEAVHHWDLSFNALLTALPVTMCPRQCVSLPTNIHMCRRYILRDFGTAFRPSQNSTDTQTSRTWSAGPYTVIC